MTRGNHLPHPALLGGGGVSKGAGQRLPKEREMQVGYSYFGHFAKARRWTGTKCKSKILLNSVFYFFWDLLAVFGFLKYINVINAGLVATFKIIKKDALKKQETRVKMVNKNPENLVCFHFFLLCVFNSSYFSTVRNQNPIFFSYIV